ncbi:MAG: subclass B1 metallo-beta-lactamase, partial [Bacteroidales bacterium]
SQPVKKIIIDDDIKLIELQDSVFIHETWHHDKQYGRFPSNGMIVVRNGKAFMVDTPVDNDKTERLVRYLSDSLSVKVTKLIIGHYHDDCLGGLEYLQSINVESVAGSLTLEKCKEIGLPVPSKSFSDSLLFDFYGETVECRFLGAGHSFDNITVYFPAQKILFGGCLVKSFNSKNLGNLSDAVVSEWDQTIKKLIGLYPDLQIIVPGHGSYGGKELLMHTIDLVEKQKSE